MASIRVRGARDNNLCDLDLDVPLHGLTVFCGPSGSGKSSLAFDTLHREGQRRYLEAMLISGTGSLRRPDVESIDGLPPTIALDQRQRSPAAQQTVASVSELGVGLSVLFGRTGLQRCPRCARPVVPRSHDTIVSELLALPDGTRLTLEAPVSAAPGVLEEISRAGFSRVRVGGEVHRIEEIGELDPGEALRIVVDRIKVSAERRGRIHDGVRLATRAGRGVVVAVTDVESIYVDRPLCVHDQLELPGLDPGRFRLSATAPAYGLDEAAVAVEVSGTSLPTLLDGTIEAVGSFAASLDGTSVSADLLADLVRRVDILVRLGLGGLKLGRAAAEVSRGELLRLRLARQVSCQVSGVLFVLDEPAAGLDSETAEAVMSVVSELVEQGNTVLCVDHHPAVLGAATRLVEFGPGAGQRGGRVVFQGTLDELRLADTATGHILRDPPTPEIVGPPPSGPWSAAGVELARGAVNVISGASGSGKTRLLNDILSATSGDFERVVHAAVGSSARQKRSSPATFTGVWNVLRKLLAQTREARVQGLSASVFSLNTSGGRCETCSGAGEVRVGLDPLPDVWLRCEVCHGRRFQADVLQVRWKGLAPDELLELDVESAHRLLAGNPKLERILRAMKEVGLGYIQLGRASDTLSGGEFRRLRLARELGRNRAPDLVVADDPSLGLHPVDTLALMEAFGRLAEAGATVLLASADPWVVQRAAHVVSVGGHRSSFGPWPNHRV